MVASSNATNAVKKRYRGEGMLSLTGVSFLSLSLSPVLLPLSPIFPSSLLSLTHQRPSLLYTLHLHGRFSSKDSKINSRRKFPFDLPRNRGSESSDYTFAFRLARGKYESGASVFAAHNSARNASIETGKQTNRASYTRKTSRSVDAAKWPTSVHEGEEKRRGERREEDKKKRFRSEGRQERQDNGRRQ